MRRHPTNGCLSIVLLPGVFRRSPYSSLPPSAPCSPPGPRLGYMPRASPLPWASARNPGNTPIFRGCRTCSIEDSSRTRCLERVLAIDLCSGNPYATKTAECVAVFIRLHQSSFRWCNRTLHDPYIMFPIVQALLPIPAVGKLTLLTASDSLPSKIHGMFRC